MNIYGTGEARGASGARGARDARAKGYFLEARVGEARGASIGGTIGLPQVVSLGPIVTFLVMLSRPYDAREQVRVDK